MAAPRSANAEEDPGPAEIARERTILDRIESGADVDGFVPFDRFMEIALYSEGVGYYSGATSPFGRAGDFYTAPHVHPLFGRALARRLKQIRDRFASDAPFRLVELGPGDGSLAATVLEALGGEPEASSRYSYVLVERTTSLRDRALERARTAASVSGIPVSVAESIGAAGPFVGAVIAHEVFDAQPVRRIAYRAGAWVELGVRRSGDRLVEAEAPLSRAAPPDSSAPRGEGDIREYARGTTALLRSISDHLIDGVALVIDYGMDAAELRRAHPRGTLVAVRRHRVVAEPWSRPGRTDLSCFVDFTRVRADAARFGLREEAYSSQAEALGRWGFPGLLQEALDSAPSAEERVRTQLAAKNLVFGFEQFRVLELAPPVAAGPALR